MLAAAGGSFFFSVFRVHDAEFRGAGQILEAAQAEYLQKLLGGAVEHGPAERIIPAGASVPWSPNPRKAKGKGVLPGSRSGKRRARGPKARVTWMGIT